MLCRSDVFQPSWLIAIFCRQSNWTCVPMATVPFLETVWRRRRRGASAGSAGPGGKRKTRRCRWTRHPHPALPLPVLCPLPRATETPSPPEELSSTLSLLNPSSLPLQKQRVGFRQHAVRRRGSVCNDNVQSASVSSATGFSENAPRRWPPCKLPSRRWEPRLAQSDRWHGVAPAAPSGGHSPSPSRKEGGTGDLPPTRSPHGDPQ